MKKCIPRTRDRIITVLAAIVCAIAAFFAFRELLYGGQPPVVFFAMGILLGGIAIHTIWRMIYMGNWGFFYNDEKSFLPCPVKTGGNFSGKNFKTQRRTYFILPLLPHGIFTFRMKREQRRLPLRPAWQATMNL